LAPRLRRSAKKCARNLIPEVEGWAMDKEERIIMGFRDLIDKITWLNRFKMEERLQGYKPSEVHCIEYISMRRCTKSFKSGIKPFLNR
jgi:hypothetical protein